MFTGHTRIAPTPSGYLHLGNIYAFRYTAQLAQKHQLSLRLRIDDLDRSRFRDAYLQDIFALLHFLNISWQAGPENPADFHANHRQSLRLPHYNTYLEALRSTGLVYACACSRAELRGYQHYPGHCRQRGLSLEDPQFAWRLQVAAGAQVEMYDFEGKPTSHPLSAHLGDFVVRRKAESAAEPPLPAYQLACVADDVLYETTHIVRGLDLFDSSLAQLYIAQLLDKTAFLQARFDHHSLLTTADGRKLSKSAGDQNSRPLRDTYASPEAFLQALQTVTAGPRQHD